MFYFIAWNAPTSRHRPDAWRKFNVLRRGVDLDANFNSIRTRDNDYLQDRAAMKAGNFTGIEGIPNQDIAMWETWGRSPTARRSGSARATSRSARSAA